MPKPPSSPPHSDIDGVARDEIGRDDPRATAGDSGRKLKEAGEKGIGRPPYADDQPNREDRSK